MKANGLSVRGPSREFHRRNVSSGNTSLGMDADVAVEFDCGATTTIASLAQRRILSAGTLHGADSAVLPCSDHWA